MTWHVAPFSWTCEVVPCKVRLVSCIHASMHAPAYAGDLMAPHPGPLLPLPSDQEVQLPSSYLTSQQVKDLPYTTTFCKTRIPG